MSSEIMNQNETAEYITEGGIPMESADLSRLSKFGAGPAFERRGGWKIFRREDVDAWIIEERTRRNDPESINP